MSARQQLKTGTSTPLVSHNLRSAPKPQMILSCDYLKKAAVPFWKVNVFHPSFIRDIGVIGAVEAVCETPRSFG